MIKKSLLEVLFKGFSIQRWNDKLRPIDLIEMDKHSHKMMIAWCLAKYEEVDGTKINWISIIRGGVYELLRRIVISDIQQPVYREIEKNEELLHKLNKWIWESIEAKIGHHEIKDEFHNYLFKPGYIDELSARILKASHIYASYWEFNIIKGLNVQDYKITEIGHSFGEYLNEFNDLSGMNKLMSGHKVKNFVDLFGQMRYQIRWGQLPRIPQTTVLGHIMMVAALSYFFSMQLDNPAPRRLYNNFFGALFHDLPESVTRDIISPLKRKVPGMSDEINRIEKRLAAKEIYPHLDDSWIPEIEYFTIDEFNGKTMAGGNVSSIEISEKYNLDEFNPYDGQIIRAADELSAFMEAWSSIKFGIKSQELEGAMQSIRYRYTVEKKNIAGIPINELYEDF